MTSGSSLAFDLQLICRIIDDNDLRSVIRNNVTLEMIQNQEARNYFRFLTDYFNSLEHNGAVPTEQIMRDQFPGYIQAEVSASMEELCSLVRRKHLQAQIVALCDECLQATENDPYEAAAMLTSRVTRIQQSSTSRGGRLVSDYTDRIKQLYRNRITPDIDVQGIPWPWPRFTRAKGRISKSEFNMVYGRPGSMKTWFVLFLAVHCYAIFNRRILFYSAEMTFDECLERWACIMAGVNYETMDHGKLNEAEQTVYEGTMDDIKNDEKSAREGSHMPGLVIVEAFEDPNGGGVSHMMQEAEKHNVDMIVCDAIYKLKDDRVNKRSMRWENQYNIIQDTSGAVKHYKIPIFATTQRARAKATESEAVEEAQDAAFADSVQHETDLLMRLKKGTQMKNKLIPLKAEIVKNRRGAQGGALFRFLPGSDFHLDHWLSPDCSQMVDEEGNESGECPELIPKKSKDNGSHEPIRRWSKGPDDLTIRFPASWNK